MPDAAALALFNITLLAAMASPGPALLLSLRNTLSGGRGAGILTGLGLATVAALWTACALTGLSAIFTVVPWLYGALKLAGALYLLWLAWGMWRDAGQPLAQGAPRHGNPLVSGLLVNLLNPKSVLFAGAVLVVIFPAGLSLAGSAVVVANHFLVEIVVYSLLAILFSRAPVLNGYLSAKHWLDRLAAGVMAALGLRLLADRL